MRDTYDSGIEAEADRAQQRALLASLNAWHRALRWDDCGAWSICGQWGSVHTWGDGKSWVLSVACNSARHWTSTKKRLGFCEVTQDGDDEGCLRLHRLPTPEQATVIRDVLGIRKKMEFAPDDLARRRTSMTMLALAARSASVAAPLTPTYPGRNAKNLCPACPGTGQELGAPDR
jgi:hypothetical protein